MANPRAPRIDEDYEDGQFELEEQYQTTAIARVSYNDGESGALLWDLSIMETLLIIVGGVCVLVLASSVAYFYIIRKLGKFSDNPWYKRRMYYAMTSSSSNPQNPTSSFNLFKRDRPNTLSLSGAVSTPPAVIFPVPTMDAAVGDDKVTIRSEGGRKPKATKGRIRSESTRKHRISTSSNAVGPIAVIAAGEKHAKKQRSKTPSFRHGMANSAKAVGEEDVSSDESGVYVTPPQDVMAPFRTTAKEKSAPSKSRAKKI